MAKIDLHNYEAYFLDHLEGNLDAQQEFELMDFLDKHPELKAELDMDLSEVQLQPIGAVQLDKSALKKEGIQGGEADDLMIASVEGLLAAKEEAELSAYITQHNLASDYKYYHSTVLQPNLTETYGNKRDLKRGKGVSRLAFFRIAGIAAGLGLLILSAVNWPFGSEQEAIASIDRQDLTVEEQLVPQRLNETDEVTGSKNMTETSESSSELNESSITIETGIQHSNPNETRVSSESHPTSEKEDGPQEMSGSKEVKDETIQSPTDKKEADSNPIQDQPQKLEDQKPVDEHPEKDLKKTQNEIKDKKTWEQEQKQEQELVSEQPIKVITNIAGNLFNKEVEYTREKKKTSDETVSHHFKFGKFEFDRKKH